MAARGTASVKVQRGTLGPTTALAFAILEWLLIFLLFVNAVFSYLSTKFAKFFELQPPCLLCSRLDHVLGVETPGFYRSFFCHEHKLEISSLVYCHVHKKLADVCGICEGCLFSFATKEKSNAERFRLLVGQMEADIECCADFVLPVKGPTVGALITRCCSCCSEPWMSRSYPRRVFNLKLMGSEFAEVDVPSLGSKDQICLYHENGLKRRRGRLSRPVESSHIGNCGFDNLSHVGYTELKINSDSESEVRSSDDNDGSTLVHEIDDLKEDFVAECVLEPATSCPDTLHNILIDDLTSEKLIHQASTMESLFFVPHMKPEACDSYDMIDPTSTVGIGHSMEELNCNHIDQKFNHSSELQKLVSLGDVLAPSSVMDARVEVFIENLKTVESRDIGHESIGKVGQASNLESEVEITTEAEKLEQVLNSPSSLFTSCVDLAVCNKGREESDMLSRQLTGRDSTRINEELKILLSREYASGVFELPLDDMSPRGDESIFSHASIFEGMQVFQKKTSIERKESRFESLEEIISREIEGESLIDLLKLQIQYDQKATSALHKELEEERSASAVAASQAMAMITRLQEEKAALHMEAFQYIRLLEEQAEYDLNALQKANALLSEREKEKQDLEAELECYRERFRNGCVMGNTLDNIFDLKSSMRVEHLDASGIENGGNTTDKIHDLKGRGVKVEHSDQ